jgi:hypothetical protein
MHKTLRIGGVPAYVKEKYGINITRATVYNCVSKGVRNEFLQCTKIQSRAGRPIRVTSADDLDEFLRRSMLGMIGV